MRDNKGTDYDSAKTVSRVVAGTVLFAIAKGVAPRRLRAATGLTVTDLLSQDGWRPQETLPAVWTLIAEHDPGRAVALEMAAVAPLDFFGPLSGAMRLAPTLRAALELALEYHGVMSELAELALVEDGCEARLQVHHPTDTLDLGHTAEAVIGIGARLCGELCADRWPLRRVEFTHAAHGPRAEYEAFFRVPVCFERERNTMVFERALLDRPSEPEQPALQAFLRAHLDTLHQQLADVRRDLALDGVREAIADGAAAGEYGAEHLARRLGMSVRSLQRRLEERGVSVQALLDEARTAAALELLADERLSIDEIAERVGYASARSFRRAFKRWTGETPAAARGRRRDDPGTT